MSIANIAALFCGMVALRTRATQVEGSATIPTGWSNPANGDEGTIRHTAIRLFGDTAASNGSSPLRTVQGVVEKDAHNPLFDQDKPWETRIDNGYPNVVYDTTYDFPWRLWYGNLGDGGQYLLFANSSDGISWHKPNLRRYNLSENWQKEPEIAKLGKNNNIVMFGGGLGIYHDMHEKNASLRYKISGGAPAGCYNEDGSKNCVVGTAGSPDGIGSWSDVRALGFASPWRPDCHTNIIHDDPLGKYLMTTRDYEDPQGREISIARTGHSKVFKKNGTWSQMYENEYPPTQEDRGCYYPDNKTDPVGTCAKACLSDEPCRYFWVYTQSTHKGLCCMKTGIVPGPLKKPACPTCGGEFYSMGGSFVPNTNQTTNFDSWIPPVVTMRGTQAHQLYSQITWRFYDVFLGIVMVFDATDAAGHVHCMLSWSTDSENWGWIDREGGLDALKEFIPAGADGAFDSHVCFAAHLPLRMPDGTSRVYYMGGNGPHSGKRNSSFALATMGPDRFAGVAPATGNATSESGHVVNITSSQMIVTVDITQSGGSVRVGIVGGPISDAITSSGTDIPVTFSGDGLVASLIGQEARLRVVIDGAVLYTVGFVG